MTCRFCSNCGTATTSPVSPLHVCLWPCSPFRLRALLSGVVARRRFQRWPWRAPRRERGRP